MAFALDRRLKLYAPNKTVDASGSTQTVWTNVLTVYANRSDKGGSFREQDDQAVAEYDTLFLIRKPLGAVQPKAGWRVVDDTGEQFVIQHVANARMFGGTRYLRLLALTNADIEDLS